MSDLTLFEKYPKIPRLSNTTIVITEKIDGTNAQIIIQSPELPILVGSRNRFITPGKATDNFGFAEWVYANEAALRRLGPGRHFGEWWGLGIGRRYGLDHQRWSLFNYDRDLPEGLPDNVSRVPVIARRQLNLFDPQETEFISAAVTKLQYDGSVAAPGFMNPEGVVVNIGGRLFKHIFNKTGPSPEEGA